jgi:hypothetical protein
VSQKFLGTGWGFPITPGPGNKVDYVSEEEKIQQSILIILGTAKGERLMRPDFGSRLHELVFAAIDSSFKSLISHYASEALIEWEPRIDVLGIDISDEQANQGKLLVNIKSKPPTAPLTWSIPFILPKERRKHHETTSIG